MTATSTAPAPAVEAADPKPAKPRKVKTSHPCECGCGTGTKSTFAPGHDMRVGPRADGKVAGETAARDAVASGKLVSPKLPGTEADRALFLSGFANGIKLGLVV